LISQRFFLPEQVPRIKKRNPTTEDTLPQPHAQPGFPKEADHLNFRAPMTIRGPQRFFLTISRLEFNLPG
jgi:hypothetical protein